MQIRPIKTPADYQEAMAQAERLFGAEGGTPEAETLDVLTTLIKAYERQHHPIAVPDPVEALLYYMQAQGIARQDLATYLGGRARVAEVLNRRRSLSMSMIRRLHQGLGIPAEVLIQPYELTRAA